MYAKLESYRKITGRRNVTAISFIVFVVSQAAIVYMTHGLGTDFLGIQITFSHEKFLRMASRWQISGLLPVYYRHFYLDYLHPVFYGVFLSSFMALVVNRRKISSKYNMLLLMPYLASLLDMAENSFHLFMLSDFSRITGGTVLASGICTNLKWAVAALSFIIAATLFLQGRKKLD